MTYPNLPRLIDAICAAYDNPQWKPRDGNTFCNFSVAYIARQMGYQLFDGLQANQMVDLMSKNGRWESIGLIDAAEKAAAGYLVIAGAKAAEHGHVCVIRPGELAHSGSWERDCPMVLNIGRQNSISFRLSQAFQEMPKIWILKDLP